MHNQYNGDQKLVQDLSEVKSVIKDRIAKVKQERLDKEEQRKSELENERIARKRRKDEAAGLTPEAKLARKREQEAQAAKRYRANRATERAAAKVAEPPRVVPEPLPKEILTEATARLMGWLRLSGRRQRQILAKGGSDGQRRYMLAQRILIKMRHELGADPQPKAFADRLHELDLLAVTPNSAGYLLRQLAEIEREIGPWVGSMTASSETMTGSRETMTHSRETMTGSRETSPEEHDGQP